MSQVEVKVEVSRTVIEWDGCNGRLGIVIRGLVLQVLLTTVIWYVRGVDGGSSSHYKCLSSIDRGGASGLQVCG